MIKVNMEVLEKILLLHKTGQYRLKDIADELNRAGFATPKGKPYYAMTVKRILDDYS